MEGCYWSVEACGWVPSPCAGDALATPWSKAGVPVPAPLPPLRDLWDVVGSFPRVPGLPGQRPTAEREAAERST